MVRNALVLVRAPSRADSRLPSSYPAVSHEDAPALAPVANRPILTHVLCFLEASGIRNVAVAFEAAHGAGVEAAVAGAPAGLRVSYLPQSEPFELARAVGDA